MDLTITNQANITYLYEGTPGRAESNAVRLTVPAPLGLAVRPLGALYRENESIVYIVTVTNRSSTAVSNVRITDNLGTYAVNGKTATPLEYAASAELYTGGVFSYAVDADTDTDGEVSFNIPTVAASGVVQLIYRAALTPFAPLDRGGSIENTVTVAASGTEGATAQSTVFADTYARIRIVKSMYSRSADEGIVCNLDVYNSGNTDATNVFVTDVFAGRPAISQVTLDASTVGENEYSYDPQTGLFTYPARDSGVSLEAPKAVFTQNPDTGAVSVIPSQLRLTIFTTLPSGRGE